VVDAAGNMPTSRQRMEESLEPDVEETAQEADSGNEVPDEENRVSCVPRYTAEAREIAENDGDANKWFLNVLIKLSKEGRLHSTDLKETQIQKGSYGEKSLLVYALELSQIVISATEHSILVNPSSTDQARLEAASSVETKCMMKMLEYEGSSPEIEVKNKKSRKRKTYMGIGGRVRDYKNQIIERKGKKGQIKPKDQPLIDRSELVRIGHPSTPPGTFSIRRAWGLMRPPSIEELGIHNTSQVDKG
jgi:hypothetical protein